MMTTLHHTRNLVSILKYQISWPLLHKDYIRSSWLQTTICYFFEFCGWAGWYLLILLGLCPVAVAVSANLGAPVAASANLGAGGWARLGAFLRVPDPLGGCLGLLHRGFPGSSSNKGRP